MVNSDYCTERILALLEKGSTDCPIEQFTVDILNQRPMVVPQPDSVPSKQILPFPSPEPK
jgi:hypothetical protein